MTAPVVGLGLGLLPLLSACMEREPLPARPRLVHLELHRVSGQERIRKLPVFSVGVPQGSRRWCDTPASRLPGLDGTEVRVWKGGGQLHVPSPPDLDRASHALVHGRFRGSHRLRLRLVEGEHELAVETTVEDLDDPIRIDLPWTPEERDRRWSQLDLTVWGQDCEIEALELLAAPPEEALPGPEDPRLLAIDDEFRRSVGLAPGRGLESSFDVTPGDELVFDLGIPSSAQVAPGNAQVVVTLEAEGQSEQHAWDVDDVTRGGRRWGTLRIELDYLAGQRVRARFELADDPAKPLAVLLANPWVGHRGRSAPTVLLITSDTHRGDHLGIAQMGVEIRTPTLDALAERGVLFEDCYSTSNITAPSHAALLTGRTPRDTGLVSNEMRLDESAFTLAEAFHSAGFRTLSAVSVQSLRHDWSAVGQGFERQYAPPRERSTLRAEQTVSRLLDWLDEAEGFPLFVWLHVFDAHFPYDPPGSFDRSYYPGHKDPFSPLLPDPGLAPAALAGRLEGLRDPEYPAAQYRGEISYLDKQLARVLEHAALAEAIVAFTSDHGEVLNRREAVFDHVILVPETLHVPLVIAWPDAPAGVRVSVPVLQPDIGRTLLDLVDLQEIPFPGENLLRSMDPRGWNDTPRFAIGDYAAHASVTAGRWFLMLHLADQDRRGYRLERHRIQLFDRESDPNCQVDVSEHEYRVARELRNLLVTWLNEQDPSREAEGGELSDEQLAQLRALGYAGDLAATPGEVWIDPDCTCERCVPYR